MNILTRIRGEYTATKAPRHKVKSLAYLHLRVFSVLVALTEADFINSKEITIKNLSYSECKN